MLLTDTVLPRANHTQFASEKQSIRGGPRSPFSVMYAIAEAHWPCRELAGW